MRGSGGGSRRSGWVGFRGGGGTEVREGRSKGSSNWIVIVVVVVVMEEGSMAVKGWVRVRGSSRFETDFANEG